MINYVSRYKINKLLFVLTISLYLPAISTSQNNHFSTISVKRQLKKVSEQWNLSLIGHYKRFHSQDGWDRAGLDLSLSRKLNQWELYGGIVSNSTFDKTEPDYWEVRPWLGLGLNNTIYKKLSLNQMFRFEWRNLLFSNKDLNKITTRYRYRLKPAYAFKKQWTVYTSYEWYILPNKDLGTRFINSGEWTLGVSKTYSSVAFRLAYTLERFNEEFQPNARNGNTISLTIIL